MANGYRTRVMGKKKPRRRLGTGARGLALSGEKIFDRRGPYFLFPSNRRSIRKRCRFRLSTTGRIHGRRASFLLGWFHRTKIPIEQDVIDDFQSARQVERHTKQRGNGEEEACQRRRNRRTHGTRDTCNA